LGGVLSFSVFCCGGELESGLDSGKVSSMSIDADITSLEPIFTSY